MDNIHNNKCNEYNCNKSNTNSLKFDTGLGCATVQYNVIRGVKTTITTGLGFKTV